MIAAFAAFLHGIAEGAGMAIGFILTITALVAAGLKGSWR